MRLDAELHKLPLQFDAERLAIEVSEGVHEQWHVDGGVEVLPLVAVDGDPSNYAAVAGIMQVTPFLEASAYLTQVLASLRAILGRTRLVRLAGANEETAPQTGTSYYSLQHATVHIPIVTDANVRFVCNGHAVMMAAGETWVVDTWHCQHVVNRFDRPLIHLVCETVGSPGFWDFIAQAERPTSRKSQVRMTPLTVSYQPGRLYPLETEQVNHPLVMSPWEQEWLLNHLDEQLVDAAPETVAKLKLALRAFTRKWRAIWARYGDTSEGWPVFRDALKKLVGSLRPFRSQLTLPNGVDTVDFLHQVLVDPGVHVQSVDSGPSLTKAKATPETSPVTAPPAVDEAEDSRPPPETAIPPSAISYAENTVDNKVDLYSSAVSVPRAPIGQAQERVMSPPAPDAGREPDGSPLRSVHTTSLPQLLRHLGVSMLVSTYQAGRLIIARADGDQLNTHFRTFGMPMGVACDGARLAVGTRLSVWEFRSVPDVARKLPPAGKHDACFLPHRQHMTGDIRIHEIHWGTEGLWIVNTRFSCLCTLDGDSSFAPRWRPPFVTELAPQDRCHLNGLAMQGGRPRFATALGQTDAPQGWREEKAFGGCVIDIDSEEIIAAGLSMPHSPRWYDNRLWVCESGAGRLALVDTQTGQLETVAQVPGYTRGLDFYDRYAFIGLSQVRETAVFAGIPLTEGQEERFSGVWVVDIEKGSTVAFLRFEAGVQEIFAVQVLPGIRFPELFNQGDNDEVIANSWMLPDEALADVPQAMR